MKIVSIMWSSYVNMLVRASKNTADILELSDYSSKALEQDPEKLDAALQEAANADIIFLYRSSEQFWEGIEKRLKELGKNIPIGNILISIASLRFHITWVYLARDWELS